MMQIRVISVKTSNNQNLRHHPNPKLTSSIETLHLNLALLTVSKHPTSDVTNVKWKSLKRKTATPV